MQVVCEPQAYPEVSKVAARLRNEYVVRIEGVLRMRKDANTKLATGKVELLAQQVCVVVNVRCPSPSVKAKIVDSRVKHPTQSSSS
jgi:aspartyl-tRNA synthetase